jgi:hypothetical protein
VLPSVSRRCRCRSKQTTELVGAAEEPAEGRRSALVELITYRVPAGVDDAAKVKAEFLAKVAKGEESCALISKEKATELLGTMLGGYNVKPLIDLLATPPAARRRRRPEEDPAGVRLLPRRRRTGRRPATPTPRPSCSPGPTPSGSPRARKCRLRRS